MLYFFWSVFQQTRNRGRKEGRNGGLDVKGSEIFFFSFQSNKTLKDLEMDFTAIRTKR
jgi:hypothetical protein